MNNSNDLIIQPGFFQSEVVKSLYEKTGDSGIITYIKMRIYIIQTGRTLYQTDASICLCAETINEDPELVKEVLEIIWPYRSEINQNLNVINISKSVFL